jgi:hypothetical protein
MGSELSLSVLLPTSLVADMPDLKQKTQKIGTVARALGIFRVKQVCIYNDDDPKVKNPPAERRLITKLLRYLETPQYLRKFLFPPDPDLRYTGLLPPLRTPHHPLKHEKNTTGSFREGVVVKTLKDRSLFEIGLQKKAIVKKRLRVGTRCTLRIVGANDKTFAAVLVNPTEVPEYWGYEVLNAENLREGLDAVKTDYRLGTSRFGGDLLSAIKDMKDNKVNNLAVIFGGPYFGLFEICERQGVDAKEIFDAVVNTIPEQGTATVRTEEALMATLTLLNLLLRNDLTSRFDF